MAEYDYDLFVIGGGSGGVRAARMSAQYGAKVAIAEESRWGGTCVIRGCVPKKLMVYASEYGHLIEDARAYGWQVGTPDFDWNAMRAARDAEVDRLEGIYLERALKGNGVETYPCRATIKDEHTVELIDGRSFTARYLLIATGSRPQMLFAEGTSLAIISDDIFHLPVQPKRLAIIGAGYIAVEFAFIFQHLGTQVTLVNRSPTVLKNFDDDLQKRVIAAMERAGMTLMLGSTPQAITDLGGHGKRLIMKNGESFEADVVFMAAGRRPNTVGLGLENVSIDVGEMEEIPVDSHSKTSVDSIYAVGDVTDRAALTPVAIREGAAFAKTVFGNEPTSPDIEWLPTAVFCQPELGTVGLTEGEAREKHEIEVYESEFTPMVHTITGRDEKAYIKLIVEKGSQRVLGIHVMGHGAGEMIQCLGIAVKMGATKADFDATVAVHPTMAEEIVTLKEPVR